MYSHVFVGGTFDGIHRGHEALLIHAYESGDKLTIGLTTDRFVHVYKKNGGGIQSYATRKALLDEWIKQKDWERQQVEVIPIDDPLEPAATSTAYDAIVATVQNKHRVDQINSLRAHRGLPHLVVIEVPLVAAADGKPISSTRQRAGEIDASGRLILPDSLRPMLARPLGTLLSGDDIQAALIRNRQATVVTVGDMTTKVFLDSGIVPRLAVIDLHVQRQPYMKFEDFHFPPEVHTVQVHSGPGFISWEAVEAIKDWGYAVKHGNAEKPTVIVVEGEEDLLTLPVVVHAPSGSYVYYGQPEQGVVEIAVNEDKVREVSDLLFQFL